MFIGKYSRQEEYSPIDDDIEAFQEDLQHETQNLKN